MKQIWLALLLIVTAQIVAQSQTTDKVIKSKLQRVTVFQQGAQLSATELVSVGSGTTNLIFENVSPQLLPNSLQAAAKGELVVMDVQYRLKYSEEKTVAKANDDPNLSRWQRELKAAQDSLDELIFVRKDINNKTSALTAEKHILTNNRLMRGEYKQDSLLLFTQSIEYLRKKLFDIDSELLKLEKENFKENILRGLLNGRVATLNTLIAGNNKEPNTVAKPIPQIIVTVFAERPTATEVSIAYYVQQAGWAAMYDLRASKESQNVELKHRATVYQNTGLDWKDVYLTLSTGNPNQESIKPVLSPFMINYDQIAVVGYGGRPMARQQNMQYNNNVQAPRADMAEIVVNSAKSNVMDKVADEEKDGVDDFMNVNQNMLRVEYEIKLKYTIESDNKTHNVVIQSKNIPAVYNYAIVPKLDPDAFLMARITDWEDMNLIAGQARIYFDGSYIGETFINPRNTNDTLQLNLGRDKSIVVTRTKLKDKCKEKTLSDSKVLLKTYEIAIRNTKNIPIRLIVEDQMPVSRDPSIKIEYLEDDGAKFNTETGKLVWDFNLKPKDTKKMQFAFEVKIPKDKSISLLN